MGARRPAAARPVLRGALACRAGLEKHHEFADFVVDLQQRICSTAEEADGKGKFIYDKWDRPNGMGYGITRVLEGGNLWEKAACSVSVVRGELSADRAAAMSSRGRDAEAGQAYAAAACSLVFHSASPMVPTFRADVRHFEIEGGDGWYGGGADLTPYYLFDEDATAFHDFYKKVCDAHDSKAYGRFKKWCDDYFFIPARKEHRGVGGVFFDDLITMVNLLARRRCSHAALLSNHCPYGRSSGGVCGQASDAYDLALLRTMAQIPCPS